MLHILSLKFKSISEQIMALTSTEFQKATIKNKTVEDVIEKSKEELIQIIKDQQKQIEIKNTQIIKFKVIKKVK